MNKLLVVEDIKNILSGEIDIKMTNNVHLNILGDVIMHDIDSENKETNILVDRNAKLNFYQVKNLKDDYHIRIEVKENSRLDYHLLVLNKGINKAVIDVIMDESCAKANVVIRAINLDKNSNLDIVCNGNIADNTIDNELTEDLKGLLVFNQDSIKISPNLMVETNEVLANHLVTIGTFNNEELFYLMMKGLSEKKAKKLLKNAFMTNILSDYEKEKIMMEVIKDE